MRIIVLNRMHLDEWLSDAVDAILKELDFNPAIRSFSRRPLPPGAPKSRGHDANIMKCFPGNPHGNVEERDAWHIGRLCDGADLVLDIHGNGNVEGSGYPFYGLPSRKSSLAMGVAGLLGLTQANVHIGVGSPAEFLPNYVGWDICPGSAALSRLPGWLRRIADGWVPAGVAMKEFRYAGAIRAEQGLRLGLSRVYDDFARLPDCAAQELELTAPVYALCWNADVFAHTGFWGQVSTPLE